jgi:DNA-directed RNA polymerase specialized sigma24 family protein
MMQPSPSDLCWVIGFTPQGRWIAPVVRAAVRTEWPEARQVAATHLGDETLAPEIMEHAIQQTAEHLADLSPIGSDEARAILGRFYRNEVRRRQRSGSRLSFWGSTAEIDHLSPSADLGFPVVEAELDLDTVLRDTPLELRRAMLMRYGARSRWSEVAEEMTKSKEAIRKSCQRELTRIRKRLGIRERAHRD